MSDPYWLTDDEMERLWSFFPESHGRPWVDDQRVLSGIVFVDRNGLRRRDAPKDYGPAKTLYNRWKRCGEAGGIRPKDGRSGRSRRRSVDRHDRRDRPEGSPHGIAPRGRKEGLG